MPVRAVTFDFWCTLFRDANSAPRQEIRIQAFAESTGAPRDAIAAALKEVWTEFSRHHIENQRTLHPEDAVRLAAQILNVALDQNEIDHLTCVFANAILEHSPEPIEGALDAVRAAAERWPIAIISDTGVSPGSVLRQLLDRHAFTECFSALTFSDEVGVAKPQALMFETTARALDVVPHEIFHIGDIELTDIAGAKGVGARCALFAGDNNRFLENTQADYAFLHWRDFLDFLPELEELP